MLQAHIVEEHLPKPVPDLAFEVTNVGLGSALSDRILARWRAGSKRQREEEAPAQLQRGRRIGSGGSYGSIASNGKKEPKQQAELTPAKLSDKNINPNFYSVMKTMLSISQRIGTVEAAILVLFTHPTICIVIEDTQATGKAYAQAIASEGKGHRRCPPHILNSENCFRAAKKALATLDIGGENKAAMNEPNQVTEAWSVSMAGRVIRVLRTTKCYSDEKMKVLICVDENYYQMAINNKDDESMQDAPVHLRHLIIDSMEQAQAVHKCGRPPKGAMEEQVSMWLDAFNKK